MQNCTKEIWDTVKLCENIIQFLKITAEAFPQYTIYDLQQLLISNLVRVLTKNPKS